MVSHVIEKQVDIWQYPKEIEGNLGSVTIGDLHGNALKLLHFYIRHGVVKFKEGVDAKAEYQQFADMYLEHGKLVENALRAERQIISNNTNLNGQKSALSELEKESSIFNANASLSEKGKASKLKKLEQTFSKLKSKTKLSQEEKELKSDLEKEISILKLSKDEAQTREAQIPREISNRQKTTHELLQQNSENSTFLANLKPELDAHLQQFTKTYSLLEVIDSNVNIRLIGDEVADRGSNDYFTLKLIDLITQSKANLSILTSNHGIEFIGSFEKSIGSGNENFKLTDKSSIGASARPSLKGLQLFSEYNLIERAELSDLVNNSYKPSLKIVDYSLGDNSITLISHAPIRFIPALKAMATKLKVTYSDSTPEELGKTIDRINNKFLNEYVNKNKVHELFDVPGEINIENVRAENISKYPFIYTTWHRFSKEFEVTQETPDVRPNQHNGYKLEYAHGHDKYTSIYEHTHNLDTDMGKFRPDSPEYSADADQKYKILNSAESNLPKSDYTIQDQDAGINPVQDVSTNPVQDAGMNPVQDASTSPHDHDARTGKFALIASAIGFGLGLIVGLALTLSGVFAPLGLGLIGLVAMAASISGAGAALGAGVGIGVAKGTEPPVEPIQQEPANKSTSLKAIGEMGGLDQEARNNLDNTASPKHSVREVTPLEPPSDSNQLAQNAQVNAAPDTPPKKVEEEAESGLSMKVS